MNSKHSVKLKSTPKIGISSGSREMNDSQATPATSVTNEDEKSFQETVKKFLSKKNDEGESLFDIIRNIVKKEFKIHETNVKELINSNVLKDNMELRKSLWEQVLEYRKQNKFACLNYRSIIVRIAMV